MIKQLILKFKTRSYLKKRGNPNMTDYANAEKIAIVVSDQFNESEITNTVVKELKKDGKETSILFFCHDIKKQSTELPHFANNDISLFGQMNNEELDFFLSQNYDFALCFDNSQHYLIDYIFSQVKAKCRIGNMNLSRKQLFDMMVQNDSTEQQLIKEVLKYLKMIKPHGQK
mgnify:CR=1 FL=1